MKWLLFTALLYNNAGNAHKQIQKNLKELGCRYHTQVIGVSKKKRPLLSYVFPGKTKRVFLITSGMHGLEKLPVVFSMNLMQRICTKKNSHMISYVFLPIMNPDAYSQTFRRRNNFEGIDLNRDAFTQKAKESRALAKYIKTLSVFYYTDIHSYGNVVISPRKVTPVNKYFIGIVSKQLGFPIYPGLPKGMWINWFSAAKRNPIAFILELGKSTEPLKPCVDLQKKYLRKMLPRFFNILYVL